MSKGTLPHSSTLAWKIPWKEEPGRLQSMGLRRVRHDWATSLLLFTFMHWRRKWQPTPVFLPGESQERGAWWAAIYGVTQSQTRLKWLSSSSIFIFVPTIKKCIFFLKLDISNFDWYNQMYTFFELDTWGPSSTLWHPYLRAQVNAYSFWIPKAKNWHFYYLLTI